MDNRSDRKWDKFVMAELRGKTMGLVGYGDIAKVWCGKGMVWQRYGAVKVSWAKDMARQRYRAASELDV